MADNSGDRAVEITEDDSSAKISALNKKLTDLERENGKIIQENDGYKRRVEELKDSAEKLRIENAEVKNQAEKAVSEIRVLGVVAARASELEAEVSRLQHDLVSTMSALEESNAELSGLKKDLEGIKEREKGKGVELAAIVKERDLLVAKVEKLEGAESGLRVELEGKEKEIRSLKKNVEELEAVVVSSKSLEKLKIELEKTVEKMKGEISVLENTLDEKEKVISGFQVKERSVVDGVNGDGVVEGGKTESLSEWKQKDLVKVVGSTIAAVAVLGVVCYVHAARKH